VAHRSGVFNHPRARRILYTALGICLILVAVYFIVSGIRVLTP